MLTRHGRVVNQWSEIPGNVLLQVCSCTRSRGSYLVYRNLKKGDAPYDWKNRRCTKCYKIDICFWYTCDECQIDYLKNFKHPAWHPLYSNYCWDDLERLVPDVWPNSYPHDTVKVAPPQKIKLPPTGFSGEDDLFND